MKGNRHAPVAQVESLLNPIAMMDVYIQVKNSRIDLQEFQNCKDYIVDVAETTGLWFFCMVEASRPVDSDICFSIQQEAGRIDGGSSWNLAHVVESIEGGAVRGLSNFVSLPEFQKINCWLLAGRVVEPINTHESHLIGQIFSDVLL